MNKHAVARDVDEVHHNGANHGNFKQRIAAEEGDERDIRRLHNDKEANVAQKQRRFVPDIRRYVQKP